MNRYVLIHFSQRSRHVLPILLIIYFITLGNKYLKSRFGSDEDESYPESMDNTHGPIFPYSTSDKTCVNVTSRLREVCRISYTVCLTTKYSLFE